MERPVELPPPVPGDVSKTRIHYLDVLKVAVVYGIFVYHSSLPFTWTSWLISNPQKSLVLTGFVLFCFPWGIPMMFLLAGADSWFALRSRPAGTFLRSRFTRLVLPLAAGIALFSPLQAYLAGSGTTRSAQALLRAYPAFFRGIRVSWTPQWLGQYGYHLWFLGYLFAISAVLLPLLVLLKRPQAMRLVAAMARLCQRPGAIYALVVPLVVSQLALRARFPAYEDWADIATYTLVFLAGYLFAAERGFEEAIRRSWLPALAIGIPTTAGVGGLILLGEDRLPRESGLVDIVLQQTYSLLWAVMIWSWLLAVLNLGIRWLDFENAVLAYMAESILPFYVLSHPVVVFVGSAVVDLHLGVWPKFLLVVGISLPATLAIYELLVRRWPLTRLVFGLKPLPRRSPAAPATGSSPPAAAVA